MKIENYEGTADTFSFPHNPRKFDASTNKFVDQKDIPYNFVYFGTTNPLKSKKVINIAGHFDGASKNSNYRDLVKHCNSNKLKKLYFADDKFFIGVATNCKRTNSAGRTLFVDYVFSFMSPFGILFSDTQKSGDNNSASKNEGNVNTPIEKITGSVTSGSKVTINDGDGNGFEFTPDATGTVTIYLIKMDDLGNDMKFSEYLYCEISGNRQTLDISNTDKSMFLTIAPDESLDTLFNGGSVTNITSPTFYFRDGWGSD